MKIHSIIGLATVLIFSIFTFTLAWGFDITIEAAAKETDAFLILKPYGCHNPLDAEISGSAESIINGVRESIQLNFIKTADGYSILKKQWPKEGNWIIYIRSKYKNLTWCAIINKGKDKVVNNEKIKLFRHSIFQTKWIKH